MDRAIPRWKAPAIGMLAIGVTMAMTFSLLGPTQSDASSHREAPLTAADPQIDGTDLYAFVSPDDADSVTLVSNWIPFEEPAGGPNFYAFAEGVRYDINVSNDGDANPEIIYRWKFKNHYRNPNTFLYNTGAVETLNDEDLNFYQTYKLVRKVPGKRARTLVSNATVAPSDIGQASFPDYEGVSNEAIKTLDNGGKTWAGQAEDPFFLDLRVFDLLYGGDFSEVGDDTLAGFNVNSMAIQIPSDELAKGRDTEDNPVIGVWTTASRRSTRIQRGDGTQKFKGPFVQLSRLGQPLVNEVVVPVSAKDYFNGSKPKNDGQFLGAVNDPELPRLIEAVYGIPAPDSNDEKSGIQRDDLIQVFLTGIPDLNQPAGVQPSEMLRLNMTTPPCESGTCAEYSNLGVIGGDVAGFPNGRRLGDDVIDIALQVFEGELIGNPNDLGDGVSINDENFRSTFPYLGLPHRGSDPTPHN
jgi:hypothetical protein